MVTEIEIVHPYLCEVCGAHYGKSNLEYKGAEVWIQCRCCDPDKVYFVNTNNFTIQEGVAMAAKTRFSTHGYPVKLFNENLIKEFRMASVEYGCKVGHLAEAFIRYGLDNANSDDIEELIENARDAEERWREETK